MRFMHPQLLAWGAVLAGALGLCAGCGARSAADGAARERVSGAGDGLSCTVKVRAERRFRGFRESAPDVVVALANSGTETLVVFPNGCSLKIEGDGAARVLLSAQPLPLWSGARSLAPGGNLDLEAALGAGLAPLAAILRGRMAYWTLAPGRYSVRAAYAVPEDFSPPADAEIPEGRVWKGTLESDQVPFEIAPPLAEARGLRMSVSLPRTDYVAGESIDLTVTFENVGDERLIVLPVSCFLQVAGKGARGIAFPGAPRPPWHDARSVEPGDRTELTFKRLSDGGCGWSLEPGTYSIRARYTVNECSDRAVDELRKRAGLGGRIWAGALRSTDVPVRVARAAVVGKAGPGER